MKRPLAVGWIAALTVGCLSCATVPVVTGTLAIPSGFLGVAHAGYSNTKAEYDLLRMLGASFSRIDFSWDIIEPRAGQFDFSRYDAIVDATRENGIGLLAILDYDVPWIHEKGISRKYIPPGRRGAWLEYVERVVERYRGRVPAYEIWNEPNWFFWKGSAEEFAVLTRETAAVIRKTDPRAAIVAGAFSRGPRAFARIMFRGGAFDQVDAISFHPYAPNAEAAASLSARFMADLRTMGFGGRFWITEAGYTTRGIYPNTIPEPEYPSELVKTITLLAITGAERLVWYTLTDRYGANEKPKGESLISVADAYFGLAYPDFTPKRGAYAYAAIARVLPGSTYAPGAVARTVETQRIRLFPFILEDGRLALIAWADASATIEFSLDLHGEIPDIDRPGSRSLAGRNLELSPKPIVVLTNIDTRSADNPAISIKVAEN
jgi:hypothetical protein